MVLRSSPISKQNITANSEMVRHQPVKLQVSIPTFNRPLELRENLASLVFAVTQLEKGKERDIGISVYNNSTQQSSQYSELIWAYEKQFQSAGVGFFDYERTGFNIGSENNCVLAILKSKGEYTWLLPDDDIAAWDSLSIILKVIEEHAPSFIHGGVDRKSVMQYEDPIKFEVGELNKVVNVAFKNQEESLLRMNVVQAQEHVYKTSLLSDVSEKDQYIRFLDKMFPSFFALLCANQKTQPVVFLSNSIGIFRDGDPSSSWRHTWLSLYCQDWPANIAGLKSLGLVSERGSANAMRYCAFVLSTYLGRLDILLGLRPRFKVKPVKLLKLYKGFYILLHIKSFFSLKLIFLVINRTKSYVDFR